MNFSHITNFFALPADQVVYLLLVNFGWIPIAVVVIWGGKELWVDYINDRWGDKQKFMLLAIDIPRGNAQSPKAVENIFTYLLGAHKTFNLIDTYWEGVYQLSFSLEIVSINGYTQFLVYTPVAYRNLVETAFYSQYPDAEITEVNDYTEGYPRKFPDDEYDIWGTEFIQSKPSAYPIKTYEEFINTLGAPEEVFKDPMASLMDLCSSLGEGEQLWTQLIIRPLGFDWMDIGDKEVSKILGEKKKSKKNIVDFFVDGLIDLMTYLSEVVFSLWSDIEDKKKEEKTDDALKMMNLKPKEKKQIEKIQEKVSKSAFEFKYRMIYLAKREVINKPKVVNGFVGFMKQFVDMDLNNLKPDMKVTATTTSYFWKERRLNNKKRKIMKNYRGRSTSAGRTPGILNIEELATIWHFPLEAVVKAPLIQKASGRRAEPPMSLPFGSEAESGGLTSSMEIVNRDEIFDEPIEPIKKYSEERDDRGETVIDLTNNQENKGDIEPDFDLGDEQLNSSEEGKQEDKGGAPSNLPFV